MRHVLPAILPVVLAGVGWQPHRPTPSYTKRTSTGIRGSSRRPSRRALHIALTLTAGLYVLWLTSLMISVARFGRQVTVTFEQGFVGVYWGGQAAWRNDHLYNHFSPPWSPGRGIGGSVPEGMTWAFYAHGRLLRPSKWASAWEYGVLHTVHLGFWPPMAGSEHGYAYLILPLWLPLALSGGATILLMFFRRFPAGPGHCPACGYNLTGNVSGVCPECGRAAPATGADSETRHRL
jgi:hypothetical protein